MREREDGKAVMEHVVAADLVRAVGEAVRMLSLADASSSLAVLAAPQATITMSAAKRSIWPSTSTKTAETSFPDSLVSSLITLAFVISVTFGCSRAGRTQHLGVGLGVDQAGEAVAGRAADAMAVRSSLVQPDPAGRVEGEVARRLEVVRELLDPRLVRDRRVRVRPARRWLGRVLATRATNLVQVLRERVVGLQLLVVNRPGRRDPVGVLELAEVLLAEPVERCAVELGRPADEVVDLRLKRLVLRVVPGVLRDVAVVDEDVVCRPVRRLPGEPVASLEEEDPLAGGREVPGERPASGARADDDDVV